MADTPDSREPTSTEAGAEGASLLAAAEAVPATLRGLFEHEQLLGPEVVAEVRRTLESVERRLEQKDLRIVVAGERRSGKSTLLDAVMGDRLLGGARGALAVVTFLRRSDVPSFRARFADGKDDDFSERVPDRASELDRTARRLETELAAAHRTCQETRFELGRAHSMRGQAEREVGRALGDVGQARSLATAAEAEVTVAEHETVSVERSIAALEVGIPASVRVPPPRWAFWLWLWCWFFVLLRRERWARYRVLLEQRARARSRLALEREQATAAAEARWLAEAEFQPLDSGAEKARLHSAELEQTLRRSERERDRIRSELEELRSEREHLVSERWRRFFTDLTALSQRPDLVELSIDYPAKLLPADVTIVDIPGMPDDASPAWAVIREQADGCILVSELERAVSQSARLFLRRLHGVVPHVLLVLTKMDQAYERTLARGGADAWAEVEEARHIGTRRFARELGRAPDRVLSVSVAAEAMLSKRGSELAVRSERELETLFALLRRERALILGAHAALALRRCVVGIADAEVRAERAYRARILELERQRTPEPAVFRRESLAQAEPRIAAAAAQALALATGALDDAFLVLARLCEQTFEGAHGHKQYVERAGDLARELAAGAATARSEARLAVEAGIERGVAAIELELFTALRARYQLLHEVGRTTSSSEALHTLKLEVPSFTGVVARVRASVSRFRRTRWALGASGAVAGAASGALLHVWYGPLAGALCGSLTALFGREQRLRADVRREFASALDGQQRACAVELTALEPHVIETIREALERSLERAMLRFARYIAEPLEAEQQAIETERGKLAELEALRVRLDEHDQELERLLEAGRRASVGLGRVAPPS